MINKIKKYIETNINPKIWENLLTDKFKLVIGLSGGPDSVFLLNFLNSFKNIEIIAAHLNHGWRKEADQDEMFCKNLCEKLGIEFISEHAKDLDAKIKLNGSKEEIGRKLRRQFFEKVLKEHDADYIALAHHQQDQQETFFMRLIRGCSLSGLTSMKSVQGLYIRPLLEISKDEILNYLHENKIEYVIDLTNYSEDFLRNRIRMKVIPALKEVDHRFDKKFETSLNLLKEEDEFLQKLTEESHEKIFTDSKGNRTIFLNLHPIIQRRLLIFWLTKEKVKFSPSLSHIDEIIRFLSHERGGSHQIHEDWKIIKKCNLFWVEANTV